ncbi:MAG: hypothetical protein JXJ17_03750 [Anaerolineae bacterium]|nr:hypothetical protein [Anaerolineae bacterium]
MQKRDKKRPISVTWLAAGAFCISVGNLIGVYGSLVRRSLYAALDLAVSPGLLAGMHGLWGVIWMTAAWGLWRLKPWARPALLIVSPVYAVYHLGQQVFLAQAGYFRGRLPFMAVMAAVLLGGIFYVMTRPRIKDAFEITTGDRDLPEEL